MEVRELVRGKQQTNAAPWWLDDDGEVCSSCHQSYAYQTGVYCLDCDANVCSVCVQETVSIELLCHGCEASRATEKESR